MNNVTIKSITERKNENSKNDNVKQVEIALEQNLEGSINENKIVLEGKGSLKVLTSV